MKRFKKFFLGALAASLMMTGCQDDFDNMEVQIPEATKTPNTTIAQIKADFWQDANNYCEEIGTNENGEHVIIKGTVISSDEAGNIFKCLYIKDETAALPMSINRYNLYVDYRVGQEVVIDLTGMHIGKYNGMLQLGYPEWYDQGNCWETSFMAPLLFTEHSEINGLPDPASVEPIEIKDLSSIDKTNAEDLQKWQGQLVRFNDAYFATPGTTLCDEYHSSGYNQVLNVNGGTINVRTSGYAKFWNYKIPEKHMDVVGILGYYGGDWQLMLRSLDDLMNIGNPTEIKGTKNNPYLVDQVIGIEAAGNTETGWVKGYIVGAVAPEVTEVKSNDDIEFGADVTLQNTLVIAQDKECKDFTKCLVFVLPQDSKLRELGNLVTNPGNYQKEITLVGAFDKVMGTFGLTGNKGTLSEFMIEGLEAEGAPIENGDGSQATPFNPTQIIAGVTATKGWVKGYIVGWVDGAAIDTGSNFSVPASSASNVLIATEPNCTDYSKCVPVQLVSGTDIRKAVNLQDNPGNLGAILSIEGSFETYFRQKGVKSPTAYELSGAGSGSGGETPPASGSGTVESPFTVSDVIGGTASGTEVWVEGYIVGWVDGKTLADGAKFNAQATVTSNILVAATADETSLAKCIPVQLPAGDVRNALNLQANPGNYKQKVALKGSVEKYFGAPGLKAVTEFKLNGSGGGTETPTGDKKFTLLTGNVTSGKAYMFYANGAAAKPVDSATASYGWLYTQKFTASGNVINAAETYGFVFKSESAGFTIRDNQGRYLYMSGSYDSFQLSKEVKASDNTFFWNVTRNSDGTYKITNVGNGKTIMYSTQYSSYGAYADATGRVYPVLYEMEGTPSTPGTTPDPTPSTGAGSEAQPFSVAQVIAGTATGTSVWVEGYIVGWVDGKTLADGAKFNAEATVATNLLLAPTADETNLANCIPVQLPAGDVRNALNLQANPGNYKQKVSLKGSVEKYFGAAGLKSVSAYKLNGSSSGGGSVTPPPTGDGGTLDKPFTVAQVISGAATGSNVYIQGYVVGFVEGAKITEGAKFSAENAAASNVLLADDANCTDVAKCIPIQLVATTNPRATLNLKDNPGNLGKLVELKGNIEKYFGVQGLKSTSEVIIK